MRNRVRVLVSGAVDKNGQPFAIAQSLRAASVAAAYANRDENIQVNGFVFILDMTGIAAKHMTVWTMDEMKAWNNCWQVSISTSCSLCTHRVRKGST